MMIFLTKLQPSAENKKVLGFRFGQALSLITKSSMWRLMTQCLTVHLLLSTDYCSSLLYLQVSLTTLLYCLGIKNNKTQQIVLFVIKFDIFFYSQRIFMVIFSLFI